ncbi:MAG: hypothetical protein AAF224_03980 [Pseudomonadota bacterium]
MRHLLKGLRRRSRGVLGVAAVCMALTACAKSMDDATPLYSAAECRRASLVDTRSGASIVGAEDMALDEARGRLIVSAYDRRAAEKAAARGADAVPQGGVYAVALSDLLNADERQIAARPFFEADAFAGGVRPHGLDFDAASGEIAFVNRPYHRDGDRGRWRRSARLERVGVDGATFVGGGAPLHCAANDLVVQSGSALVSHDHGACGWRAGLEDVFGLKRGGIVFAGAPNGSLKEDALVRDIKFANGLTKLADGALVLAATRESAVRFFMPTDKGARETGRLSLPGGPDNISPLADGGFVAAVHPSLMAIGLARKLGLGRAPSRLVRVGADSKTISLLFDDPKGALFSGASVGVTSDDWLVAGSATDAGLLVCQKSGPEKN